MLEPERVADDRRLVVFLYLLLRDKLPAGELEHLLSQSGSARDGTTKFVFSNPHLARCAQEAAGRLLGEERQQLEEEVQALREALGSIVHASNNWAMPVQAFDVTGKLADIARAALASGETGETE